MGTRIDAAGNVVRSGGSRTAYGRFDDEESGLSGGQARSALFQRLDPRRWKIAPVFLLLTAAFLGFLVMLYFVQHPILCFLCVLCAWLMSLACHEFGHAYTAYRGGDLSVEEKGYLTLDLTKYVDPLMSILIPTIILAIGGMALPGGAVYIQPSSLRSKSWETFVSLAGPMANFIYGAVTALVFHLLHWVLPVPLGGRMVLSTLALIAWFQAMAMWFNLIPLPPLDGWGALRPWLHEDCVFKRWERHPWHSKSMTLVCILILFIGLSKVSGQRTTAHLLLVAVCVCLSAAFRLDREYNDGVCVSAPP